MRTLLAALAFAGVFTGQAFAAPIGCGNGGTASPSAPVLGSWQLRYRDDGGNWSNYYTHVFLADGTWTENGTAAGHWCMLGDLVLWAWDTSPNTTFRATYNYGNPNVMTGTESWTASGTGTIEVMRR